MSIQNSQMWWYWPQIPWEVRGWSSGLLSPYPEQYEAIWNDFEDMEQDGENVTRDDLIVSLDDLGWTELRPPEGYLRSDDPYMLWVIDEGFVDLVSVDDPEPSDYPKVSLQTVGYIVWQWYRLHLAMQASKLTQFGRRG